MRTAHSMPWLMQVGKGVMRSAALISLGISINALVVRTSAAQIAQLPQPEYSLVDENGVDLLSFGVSLRQTDTFIGSRGLPFTHTTFGAGGLVGPLGIQGGGTAPGFIGFDNFFGSLYWPAADNYNVCSPTQPVYIRVILGSATEYFYGCHTFTASDFTGSSLSYSTDGTTAYYVQRDGTTVVFSQSGSVGTPQQILYPDGRVLTYWYVNDGTGAPFLKSITRSDGLQLKYTYSQVSPGLWSLSSVTAINNAYEYCSPTASTCSLQRVWPTATYSFQAAPGGGYYVTITDAAGRATRYTEDTSYRTVAIKLPSSASTDNVVYTYCDNNCPQYSFEGASGVPYQGYVLKVVRDGQTWSYTGNPGSPTNTLCSTATYGFTSPVGSGTQVSLYNCLPNAQATLLPGTNPLIQLTDQDGVQFNTGIYGRISSAIKPEGNQSQFTWDSRGNLTQETAVPKPGSPLTQVTRSAYYPCNNGPVSCNEPTWVKDGLLNETDYTYDPAHGGVLTATLPADSNGIRPQTTYTYTQRYAWMLNAAGAYVKSAAPIWVVATETVCRASAATPTGCATPGDQVVKTYEYGPDSGPNNLFLRGIAITADGVTHRTCYGYDPQGNRISETRPNAGLTSCP